MIHEIYMQRCLELAANGRATVSPNPMVGALLVYDNKIIGEGWHRKFGEAHAEVNAIESVNDKSLLSQSTLYVSLEPCNHFGKTPPCTDLILKYKIPRVVIGCRDTHELVDGKGIEKLKAAGVEVIFPILETACQKLNEAFFLSNNVQRPYVILKWAASKNGVMGDITHANLAISNAYSRQLVHKWRSESDAIMVGTATAALDNPELTVRDYVGKNPIRIVLDETLKLKPEQKILDGSVETLVFTHEQKQGRKNLEYIQLKKEEKSLPQILRILHQRKIQKLFVEGGAKMLQSFIDANLWDEARLFVSDNLVDGNVKSPQITGKKIAESRIKNDTLVILKNNKK